MKFTRVLTLNLKNNLSANGTINNTTDGQISTNERIVCRRAAEQKEALGDLGAQEVKPHRGKNGDQIILGPVLSDQHDLKKTTKKTNNTTSDVSYIHKEIFFF